MDHATARIKRDLMDVITDKTLMIQCVPDENDIKLVHALIEGPIATPFEGGFYYFHVHFPSDYPNNPPTVQLQTSEPGNLHLYPNQYNTGKVCLSILNTWDGPGWSAVHSLKSVLLSVQSLMVEEPYYPATFKVKTDESLNKESKEYNERVRYEVVRLALIAFLEDACQGLPNKLKDVVVERFKSNFWKYFNIVDQIGKEKESRGDFSMASSLNILKQNLMSLKDKFGVYNETAKSQVVEEPVPVNEEVSSVYVDPPIIVVDTGNVEFVMGKTYSPEDDVIVIDSD